MADLYQTQKELDEKNLEKAIRTHDLPTAAVCLRRLANVQITPDIVNKLADYLDPAIESLPYDCGPKPHKKTSRMLATFTTSFEYNVISYYYFLCERPELARCVLYQDREEFFLVEDSEVLDTDGNFSPKWKYPQRERKRENTLLPKKEIIKSFICEMYDGISARTFDKMRAEYHKFNK